MAIRQRAREGMLRHHFDRGIQYYFNQYQDIHKKPYLSLNYKTPDEVHRAL